MKLKLKLKLVNEGELGAKTYLNNRIIFEDSRNSGCKMIIMECLRVRGLNNGEMSEVRLSIFWTAVFLFTLCLTQFVHAGAENTFPFPTTDWKYSCGDQKIQERFRKQSVVFEKLITQTLASGYHQLIELNPSFKNLDSEIINQKVEFSCDRPKQSEALAVTENRRSIGLRFGSRQIGFGKETKVIKLGKVLDQCLRALESVNTDWDGVIDLNHLSTESTQVGYTVTNSKSNFISCQEAIFHEFLHFLRADNLPVKTHNGEFKEDLFKTTDVVYSCTRVAFSYGDSPVVDDSAWQQKFHRENWLKSCQTCATAQIGKKGYLESNVSKKNNYQFDANQVCKRHYDEIPYVDVSWTGVSEHYFKESSVIKMGTD